MVKNSKMNSAKLISPEELETILAYLENKMKHSQTSLRNYTIILLLADAGCRVGECVRLEISDILQGSDLVMALRIRSAIAKYKIERIVPLSNRLRGSLHQYLNSDCNLVLLPNLYLFPGSKTLGTYLSVRQVENIVGSISLAAIGRSITPHTLRHSFATRLIQTTPLPVVQELLGHRNLSSTQVYVHPTTQDLFDAIDKL